MASLEKKDKTEEYSEEEISSDEDDLETKAIKSEVLAKLILEEMKALRFDLKSEIRTVCNHFIKLFSQAAQSTTLGKLENGKMNILSNDTPASSAEKKCNSLESSENTADGHLVFSPCHSNLLPGLRAFVGLKYELLPPLPDRHLDPNEFSPDLDTPMTTDSSSTCSNPDKPDLPTSDKESAGEKEKSIDSKDAENVAVSSSKSTSNFTQNAVSTGIVCKKLDKKLGCSFINSAKLNKKVKKVNFMKEKRKIKTLKSLSLQSLNIVCENNYKSHLFLVQSTNHFRKVANNNQPMEEQVDSNSNCIDNRPALSQSKNCDNNANICSNQLDGNIPWNKKIVYKSVVSPLYLSEIKSTTHKVISKLKTKDWKYRLADKCLSDQSTVCISKSSSTSSICQDSASVSDIACRLNRFEINSNTDLKAFSSEEDMFSIMGKSPPKTLCQNKVEVHMPTLAKQSEPAVQNIRVQSKLELPKIKLLSTDDVNICKKKCRTHRCNICQRIFPYSWLLKNHIREHTKKRLFPCQVCAKSFSGEKCRNQHLLTAHFGVKCYECKQCGRYYSTKESLQLHEKSHTGLKPFVCKVCDMSFSLNSALERHVREAHTNADLKLHQCDTCEKLFASEEELVCHVRIHTGEKPYACKKCGRHFRSAENLQRHLLSTHFNLMNHNCKACEMSFGNAVSLKCHIANHHSENKFQCMECDKTFSHYQDLKFHMKNHEEEQEWKCPYCVKAFKDYSAMKKHKRGHYTA